MESLSSVIGDPESRVQNVPTEIWSIIFRMCSKPLVLRPLLCHGTDIHQGQKTLARIARVCRRFRDIATILLHEALAWGRSEHEILALVRHFRAHPRYASLVQRLYYDRWSDKCWNQELQNAQAFPPFASFVNLKYLALGGASGFTSLIIIRNQVAPFPNLETFTLDQAGRALSIYVLRPILILPSLKEVRLYKGIYDLDRNQSEQVVETQEVPQSNLVSSSVKLKPLRWFWCVESSLSSRERIVAWLLSIRGIQGLVMREVLEPECRLFVDCIAPYIHDLEIQADASQSGVYYRFDFAPLNNIVNLRVEVNAIININVSWVETSRYMLRDRWPIDTDQMSRKPVRLPTQVESFYLQVTPWKIHRGLLYEYLLDLVGEAAYTLPCLKKIELASLYLPMQDSRYTTYLDAFAWDPYLVARAETSEMKSQATYNERRAALGDGCDYTPEHRQLVDACNAAGICFSTSQVTREDENCMMPGRDTL